MPVSAPAPAAAASPPAALRRNESFRMLWVGQVLSDTGSGAGHLAYPLLILALTHSAVLAGVTGTAASVVQFCLRLPAGALSDRLDRRRTMIICDTGRAGLLALLGVLVLLHLVTWPVVVLVAVLDSAGDVIFSPAATAALPAIVASEQLEEAWAATEARTYAADLAGPALGGLLFGLATALPFLGDAISYLVSAGTVSQIRGRFRPQRPAERTSLWHEALDGVRLVWKHPLLRAVTIQAPIINFAISGVLFTITVALRRNGTAPGIIGLVQAGIAVGGLAGALIAPRLQKRLRLSQLVIVFTIAGTLLFAAAALLVPSPVVAVPVAIAFLLAPAANAALFAVMLRAAPEDMRGRVNNTILLAATGLAALAPLAAGLLVQHLNGSWALSIFTAAMAAAAVLCVILPGLRNAESASTPS